MAHEDPTYPDRVSGPERPQYADAGGCIPIRVEHKHDQDHAEPADRAQLPDPAEYVRCGRCKTPFDPEDTRWDGQAQHDDTPFCRSCVDRCHESTDAFHLCHICNPGDANIPLRAKVDDTTWGYVMLTRGQWEATRAAAGR